MKTYEDIELYLGDHVTENEDVKILRDIYSSHLFNINLEKIKLQDINNIFEINELSTYIHTLEENMFNSLNNQEITCVSSLDTKRIGIDYKYSDRSIIIKLYNKFNGKLAKKIVISSKDFKDFACTNRDSSTNVNLFYSSEDFIVLYCYLTMYEGVGFNIIINKNLNHTFSQTKSVASTMAKVGGQWYMCKSTCDGDYICDSDFNILSPPLDSVIFPPSNGYVIIKRDNLYGYAKIHKGTYTEIIEPMFSHAEKFVKGVAKVKVPHNDETYLIDFKGIIIK